MISQSLVDMILSSQQWPADNDFMAWRDEDKDRFLAEYCKYLPWQEVAFIVSEVDPTGKLLSLAFEDAFRFTEHVRNAAYSHLEGAVQDQILNARMKKAG